MNKNKLFLSLLICFAHGLIAMQDEPNIHELVKQRSKIMVHSPRAFRPNVSSNTQNLILNEQNLFFNSLVEYSMPEKVKSMRAWRRIASKKTPHISPTSVARALSDEKSNDWFVGEGVDIESYKYPLPDKFCQDWLLQYLDSEGYSRQDIYDHYADSKAANDR